MEKKILIVDDDKSMARMLSSALKTLPIKLSITSVPSGEEAMLTVILDHPALMIVDLGLPGMSGWDLLALVRKRNPQMAVILTTGKRDEEVLRRVQEFNVNACFFKPVELEDLLAKAQELLTLESTPSADTEKSGPAVTDIPALVVPEEQETAPKKNYKQIVRDLRELMNADGAALLADSGHLLVQSGRELATVLNEGWEIKVMAALSAVQALERILENPVTNQYLLLRTTNLQALLLAPVGRNGLLVLLSNQTAEQLTPDIMDKLFAAQTLLTEFDEPFIMGDTGRLTPASDEAADEYMAEEELQPAEINLDDLFMPADMGADADSFWDDATESAAGESSNTGYLSFSQAEQLGLVPDDMDD